MFQTLSVPKGYGKLALPGSGSVGLVTPAFGARPVATNSEYLSIADASQTGLDRGTTDFSVGIWFYRDVAAAVQGLMTKKATATGQDAGWSVKLDASNRRQVRFCDASAANITFTGTNNEIALDTLYLLICTFDRDGNMTTALNGGVRSATAISAQPGDVGNAAAFQLFKDTDAAAYLTGGAVCAFIYDGLLSEADEDTLYNAGSPLRYSAVPSTLQSGMVSYWNLDEQSTGAGAVTRNDSKGTNHLTDNGTTPSSAFPFTG